MMQQRSSESKLKKWIFFVAIIALVLFPVMTSDSADLKESIDTKEESELYLFKGDLVALKVYSLTRIAISNPDIVDVANADVNEVLIVGQKVGTTQIFIWDELGKRQVIASVLKEDLDLIVARLQKLFKQVGIENIVLEKNNYEGRVVVSGKVKTDKYGDFKKVLDKFGDNVINLVREDKVQDLIQIDIQVTELSTTLNKAMGIDWTAGGSSGISLSYPETLPALDGTYRDFFKIGDFSRTSALLATISFLISEGKARVLSKPSIVVTNGEKASLLVGGEIPIRTTTTSTGGASVQENVSFKSYGIDVNVTPTMNEHENKIDLILDLQVRDIDASTPIGSSGDIAFTNRSAKTKLYVNDGQTIVIAGLIKQNRSESVNRVPFLSKIPVVGLLFRSQSKPSADFDQEMVITITPKRYKEDSKEKEEGLEAAVKASASAENATGTSAQSTLPQDELRPVDAEVVAEDDEEDARDKALGVAEETGKNMENKEDEDFAIPGDLLAPDEGAEGKSQGEFNNMNAVESSVKEEDMDSSNKEDMAPALDQDDSTDAAAPVSELTEDIEPQEKAIAGYVQGVQKTIADAISFPYEAREKGWEGTVTLSLTILSDGTLQDVEIKKSSGHNVFDSDAKNTAQILSPFDPFPSELDLEEIIVSLPIVYSQKMLTQ